jgi:predicted metal-dependent hydrolase
VRQEPLVVAGRRITGAVRISRRARRLSLLIRPDAGLIVIAPVGCADGQIRRFVRQHEAWIARQLARWDELASRLPRRWPYGATLPYRGQEHRVLLEASADGSAVIRRPPDELWVRMRTPGVDGATRLLRRWFGARAHRWLLARTAVWGARMGLCWRRLTVRDLRRRWGSCSSAGSLSFNWRLIMAPPAVLDYVVIHELAHLREPNHSRRFWVLVAAWCPQAPAARRWLRTDGPFLSF